MNTYFENNTIANINIYNISSDKMDEALSQENSQLKTELINKLKEIEETLAEVAKEQPEGAPAGNFITSAREESEKQDPVSSKIQSYIKLASDTIETVVKATPTVIKASKQIVDFVGWLSTSLG